VWVWNHHPDLTPVTFLPPFPVASARPCPAVRRLPRPSQQGAQAWSLGGSTRVARFSFQLGVLLAVLFCPSTAASN